MQLGFQGGVIEPAEPLMSMYYVANDLPGNAYSMHPAAGANLVDTPDRITDSVMIEIDPVLKMGSMAIAGVMNSLEEIASEKDGELDRINSVIFIAFAGDRFIAPRLRDNEFIDFLTEVAKQPACHRSFFHRRNLFTLKRTQDRTDSGYRSRH
jgi:hypothetical protein